MEESKEFITFDDLRELAIKEEIADNKVSVGLWAKIKGFKRVKRVIRNNKFVYLYSKDD